MMTQKYNTLLSMRHYQTLTLALLDSEGVYK
jgi:hypothetical protein